MCERPTWEVDERERAAARAAGWRESDLEWESASERALARAADGDWKTADELWTRALAVAREHFPPDDPRLGAALANPAAARFLQNGAADFPQGGSADAKAKVKVDATALAESLAESRRVWAQSPGWIDRMRLEHLARSSVHHLRMEAKNRGVYEAVVRRRLHDFAAEARWAVENFADGGEVIFHSPRRWRMEKPPIFGDTRKLLSACLLLSFRPRQ